jgi:plastocyanin
MRLRTLIVVALAGCATAAVVAATSGAAPAKKTAHVTVADDYYSPTTVKIKKGSKVSYDWSDANVDSHNVHLTKGPKGVKKRTSSRRPGRSGSTSRRSSRSRARTTSSARSIAR